MYEEVELKHLEYQLHAVMVHEGGVDSGHYWAYVKDHKKQVKPQIPFTNVILSEMFKLERPANMLKAILY